MGRKNKAETESAEPSAPSDLVLDAANEGGEIPDMPTGAEIASLEDVLNEQEESVAAPAAAPDPEVVADMKAACAENGLVLCHAPDGVCDVGGMPVHDGLVPVAPDALPNLLPLGFRTVE